MKDILSGSLIISLTFLGGCATPLTGQQRCALIGEMYEGSIIGSQTHIGSVGTNVYSYQTTEYQPRCRLPRTDAEKKMVKEIQPSAQKIKSSNANKIMWATVGILVGSIALAGIIVGSIKR